MSYRTKALDTEGMPPGIPHIIVNEAAERFSFYGMKAVLVVFMTQYLWLMGDRAEVPMSEVRANQVFHTFGAFVYFLPIFGAILSDLFWGKYNTIIWLSLVYCAGHGALALMGVLGDPTMWLFVGLGLIALGAGGIKPCVSAHVGDQFGRRNQHLLVRIFNWFYFAINLGAFASTALTPFTLEWYGPHWAFGIPGVLMALATLVFWLGRKHFAHLPARPGPFLRELTSRDGVMAIVKLLPLVLFVGIFWALFDQTGSSWIFQLQDMDREIFGVELLPSQVQAVNPILILTLVPLFAYVIYPLLDRFFKLTALRKISIGLFLAALAFTVPALTQEAIDRGQTPHVSWQILAFLLLTMSEIMVSIVCLEFFYTQAPLKIKSLVMSIGLLPVFLGNQIIVGVNHWIEVPSVVENRSELALVRHAGLDGIEETEDDVVCRYRDGILQGVEFADWEIFARGALQIENFVEANGRKFPDDKTGQRLLDGLEDQWGNSLIYELRNRQLARIRSVGADGQDKSRWDQGVMLRLIPNNAEQSADSKKMTWLEKRKRALDVEPSADAGSDDGVEKIDSTEYPPGEGIERTYFSGGSAGMTSLEGARYFWFFTKMMLITAVLFVPFAKLYRVRNYLNAE